MGDNGGTVDATATANDSGTVAGWVVGIVLAVGVIAAVVGVLAYQRKHGRGLLADPAVFSTNDAVESALFFNPLYDGENNLEPTVNPVYRSSLARSVSDVGQFLRRAARSASVVDVRPPDSDSLVRPRPTAAADDDDSEPPPQQQQQQPRQRVSGSTTPTGTTRSGKARAPVSRQNSQPNILRTGPTSFVYIGDDEDN